MTEPADELPPELAPHAEEVPTDPLLRLLASGAAAKDVLKTKPFLAFTVKAYGIVSAGQVIFLLECDRLKQFAPFLVRADEFKDGAHMRTWLRLAREMLEEMLPEALLEMAITTAAQAARKASTQTGIANLKSEDLKAADQSHVGFLKSGIKKRAGARGRGQPSQWGREELALAVTYALVSLPTPRSRSYDGVSKILRGTHGGKAPPSGDALRKLLEWFGLDWTYLKGKADSIRNISLRFSP